MGGLGLMQEQITQQNHDDLGCDGWEISAHAASAPDHEPIQGKQYSDKEYEALNNSLVRRIGTLNCGHAAFPIILGVNSPQYTPGQLEQFRVDNEKGVTFDGKHYTCYQATQAQRKLERSIRRQKRRVLVDEAVGDKDKLLTDQIKLQRYRQEYARFSKAAGLRTQDERLHVAGFGSKQATRAANAAKMAESQLKTASGRSIIIVKKTSTTGVPDSVTQRTGPKGGIDRNFYGPDGKQTLQISNNNHGNPKMHPFGKNGEHAHDYIWDSSGKIVGRPVRELTDLERKENEDIL